MGEARRKPDRRARVRASLELSRELVFYDDGPVQRKFEQRFRSEIDAFINTGFEAHSEVERAGKEWPKNDRLQHIVLFLHVALNSLFTSAHFLVSGYHQAAGYQARTYGEACAMAMLMLSDDEWKAFASQKTTFPSHKAMDRITRKATANLLEKKLALNLKGWAAYNSIQRLYDQFAHAGAFTLALHLNLRTGATIIGGEFDPVKQSEYGGHLVALAQGATSLAELSRRIGMHTASIT